MALDLLGWLIGGPKKKSVRGSPPNPKEVRSVESAAAPNRAPVEAPPGPASAQRPKGHAEAARRIAAFVKRSATAKNQWLDLSGLEMSTLPPEIDLLGEIVRLNLNNNALSDQAIEPLSRLLNLKQLRLRKNKLTGSGLAALAVLRGLEMVDVSFNEIGKNPAGLARLSGLVVLYVNSNQINAAGAASIAALPNLTELHGQNNKFGDEGARALAKVSKLRTLYLVNNQIGPEGARALAALKSLTTLNLDNNKIGSAAAALAALTALKSLDLSRTGVSDLDFLKSLKKLKTLFLNGLALTTEDAEVLNRPGMKLYLSKAKLGDFPPEALSKHNTDDCMRTLRKHIEARKEDDKPKVEVRDVKVMLLGNGRVGKTQLRRRLKGDEYDEHVGTTHGVEIVPISLPPASDAATGTPPTPLQVWDFGGQDIYLGTHALFMKTRAVFPILWTPESEANETHYVDGIPYRNYPLNEWLRYVLQLAGEESPVLLVQSQCEAEGDRVDPNVDQAHRFVKQPRNLYYSAKLGQPEDALLIALRGAISDLGEPKRISARWNRVKAKVEQRAKKGDKRITRADFNRICNDEKVTDPEAQSVLLKMLHDFGTVFHDQDVLGDLIVLDQNWALQAIYALFERLPGTYERLQDLKGRFTLTDLGHLVWNKDSHSTEDQAAFVAMMVACKAAFELRPKSDEHGEALYIAPDLLPERKFVEARISRYDKEPADSSREFEFAFALPSMLRELMGRWASQAGQEGVYWQEGLFFKKSKSYAIVEAMRPDDRSWRATIRIRVWRGNAAKVVEELSKEVVEVAGRFGAEAKAGTEDLLDPPSQSEEELEATADAAFSEPLEPAEPDESPPAPRCFISYAWGGNRADDAEDNIEAARNRALAFERVEARLRELKIEPYFDKQRLRHGESISAFMSVAAKQERFVVILSKKYLESAYCMDELLRIYRNCRSDADEFRSRVRAIVLDDAPIDSMEERDKVSSYWWAQKDKADAVMLACQRDKRPPEAEAIDTLRVAFDLTAHAATILARIKDAYPIRSIDQIKVLSF